MALLDIVTESSETGVLELPSGATPDSPVSNSSTLGQLLLELKTNDSELKNLVLAGL